VLAAGISLHSDRRSPIARLGIVRLNQPAQLAPRHHLFHSSRNNARLVFFVYRSNPVIIACVLCFMLARL
jgi:hypothetical protein